MVKVLFLPLNFGDVNQQGVADAFSQAGCEVRQFDYFAVHGNSKNIRTTRTHLINTVDQFKPDLMHCQIQHTSLIDASTISTIKKKHPNMIVTNWTGDVRNYVPPTFLRVARVSDYNLISSTGQMEMFRQKIGKPVHYWQIGYNPSLYHPETQTRTNFEFDCVFIAHHNKKENYPGANQRMAACRMLNQDFGQRFGLFGHHWPNDIKSRGSVDQKRVASIYHKSISAISISHYNDLNHYFSDRLLMCLASGRPVVSLRFPGWESYFTDMCDLVIADSLEDIPKKVRMLRDNPDLANFIGRSGAAKVFAEHTYYSRVVELLEMIGLKQ